MSPITKTGVLLVNQGTPDSPSVADVCKYLREFLMDERVMDLPFLKRWPLVNLAIAPFRAPKSAKVYQQLWTPEGSPLKVYGYRVTSLLQASLGANYVVKLAMRYQNPAIEKALAEFQAMGITKLVIVPLYPQYASATTGSVHQKVMETVTSWTVIPEIRFAGPFWHEPRFIRAFAKIGQKHLDRENYEHLVFTYHGLPERQLHQHERYSSCQEANCQHELHAGNQFCYRAQCYATSRAIALELGIAPEDYSVCFQSRLGRDPWIQPYTDDTLRGLAAAGLKKVLVFAPSFIADCLETTIEVGEEYRELFEELGGTHWQLVESLNDDASWISCLHQLVTQQETPRPSPKRSLTALKKYPSLYPISLN
ncbi:ferrochelatase [Rufibacter sediminis]|uniref:Ferrochelatase n=1 Tax=Rufibacter sediminis TaxID=2762756 RepID=A0ABR6VSW9_9BACT|nr:ferrochelatase [Rufibacter sediminis]MBC3540303.1 ferrochelatase [Rufibacter sediminis]